MSNCIAINGLEHLPSEQTLLIHYNILCTGTWYLSQLLSAYRNVCDTEWTVMYPNFQHPRHTDFPIAVDDPGFAATFAWNYGGIQGISSENFDAYHSYLVQLTILNYECFNTGETGTPGTGTGTTTGTGTSGGTNTGNGGFGGWGGGGGPPGPGGGGGTPSVTVYTIPEWRPPGGSNPDVSIVTPLPPGGGGGIGGGIVGGFIPIEPTPPGGGGGGGGVLLPLPIPFEPLPPGAGGGGGGEVLPGITPVNPTIPGGGVIPGGIPVLPKFPVDPGETNLPGGNWQPGVSRLPGLNSAPPGGGTTVGFIPTQVLVEPPVTTNPLPGGFVSIEPEENVYKEPSIPIEPGLIPGGNTPNVINTPSIGVVTVEPSNPIISNNPVVTNYFSVERPSLNPPGSTSNPFLAVRPLSINPAVNTETNVGAGGIPTTIIPDINTVNESSEGQVLGGQPNIIIGGIGSTQSTQGTINTSSIEYNSYIDIQTPFAEIEFGNLIVISSFFSPPVSLSAQMILTIQDSVRSVEVSRTSVLSIAGGTPLTCGGSFISSVFELGPVVLMSKVVDSNGNIIALKSTLVSIIQKNNEGTIQSSNTTRDRGIPPEIINNSIRPISTNPLEIYLPTNTSKYIVFESTSPQTSISAVLKTRYNSEDKYSITALAEYEDFRFISTGKFSIPLRQSIIELKEIGHSDKRYTIDGQEVYLDTHNAGLANVVMSGTDLVVLELSPAAGNVDGDTEGLLYVSENFYPRRYTATATSTSISAQVRFAANLYGLIISGPESGVVPPNYIIKEATSTLSGTVTWPNLTLAKGDYYSIIETTSNNLNPFSSPVYVGKYT